MTAKQLELVELMRSGWTPVIYRDDPRTRYYSPVKHVGLPRECRRGHANVVLALLRAGIIEVASHEPDRHSSMNGKLIGGSTKYRLVTNKG